MPVYPIADYTYTLPEDRIAQYPLAQRDASKLLQFRGEQLSDHSFTELPDLLPADTLLVVNNTRVVPVRLHLNLPSGASVEVFCLEPGNGLTLQDVLMNQASVEMLCLIGGNRKWKEGHVASLGLESPELQLQARRIGRVDDAFVVELSWSPAEVRFVEVLALLGEMPLPPYMRRKAETDDDARYQTAFAQQSGAVAAPTAGLHFTPQVLEALHQRGIRRAELTLHVGAGTFKPVSVADAVEHQMHAEHFHLSADTARAVAEATGPIVAVGTTSMRTLESAYWLGAYLMREGKCLPDGTWLMREVPQWIWQQSEAEARPPRAEVFAWWAEQLAPDGLIASTQLMVAPGYPFRVVDGLITNFHQPQSTLLLLVAAFIGPAWKDVYAHALAHDYRFLSYGDSSLLWR